MHTTAWLLVLVVVAAVAADDPKYPDQCTDFFQLVQPTAKDAWKLGSKAQIAWNKTLDDSWTSLTIGLYRNNQPGQGRQMLPPMDGLTMDVPNTQTSVEWQVVNDIDESSDYFVRIGANTKDGRDKQWTCSDNLKVSKNAAVGSARAPWVVGGGAAGLALLLLSVF
ncbi:hypothetical protein RI367_008387 [Sorochytrium milnesiophthora]